MICESIHDPAAYIFCASVIYLSDLPMALAIGGLGLLVTGLLTYFIVSRVKSKKQVRTADKYKSPPG